MFLLGVSGRSDGSAALRIGRRWESRCGACCCSGLFLVSSEVSAGSPGSVAAPCPGAPAEIIYVCRGLWSLDSGSSAGLCLDAWSSGPSGANVSFLLLGATLSPGFVWDLPPHRAMLAPLQPSEQSAPDLFMDLK